LPAPADARRALRALGGSIVVLQSDDLLKAHIHTDTPDAVFTLGAEWGHVEYTKAEDMRAQHAGLREKRPIAFVTDTACDLPDSVVFEHGIGLVPTQLIIGDRAYRDRLEMTPAEFFQRLRAGDDATTSQPSPDAFRETFVDALRTADRVVAVVLSKALSGTYASAERAAKALDPPGRVELVNSRGASLTEGMLVLRGLELAAEGWDAAAIARELDRVRDQSGGIFTADNLERLIRSGRVGRLRGWLGTRLDVKPIMALTRDGRAVPVDRARGREAARTRILARLEQALTPRPGVLRLGIAHGDIPEFAAALRDELVERYQPKEVLVSPITPVIAAHTGIGAWGVFYQIEDGTKQ